MADPDVRLTPAQIKAADAFDAARQQFMLALTTFIAADCLPREHRQDEIGRTTDVIETLFAFSPLAY